MIQDIPYPTEKTLQKNDYHLLFQSCSQIKDIPIMGDGKIPSILKDKDEPVIPKTNFDSFDWDKNFKEAYQ